DVRILTERTHVEVLQALSDVAARHRHVLPADRIDDIAGRELHRDQPVADQVDVDLAVDTAPYVYRPDAGYLLEAANQVELENASQILEGQRGARAEHDDRLLVRIELADLRRIRLGRETLAYP